MGDKKKQLNRKARYGVVVTIEERPGGKLGMVMDTVEKQPDSDPDEWLFQKNLVSIEHPAELMENLQMTRRELADIGETLMIWLLSREGRFN